MSSNISVGAIPAGSENCVSGTYNKSANSQFDIDFGLIPSRIEMFYEYPSTKYDSVNILYDSNINNFYLILYKNDDATLRISDNLSLNGNHLISDYGTDGSIYASQVTYSYMACK
ncbi:MAG: hypothetical protein E7158_03790 [Firmicutes bacterium]|nr:hypothetical protein [Bacillota bacterium]